MRLPVSLVRVLCILGVLALLLAAADVPVVQARVEVRVLRRPAAALQRFLWREAATCWAWGQELLFPIGVTDVLRRPLTISTLVVRTVLGGVLLLYLALGWGITRYWMVSEECADQDGGYDESG